MQQYYDMVKKKKRDDAMESAKDAALTSGEFGAAYGALNSVLHGAKSIPGVLLRSLGTGAVAGAAGGGAAYLGNKLIGSQTEDNPTAHTQQGTVGGALGGGTLGAGSGYLLGSGKLNWLKVVASAPKEADNLVLKYIKKKAANPSLHGGLKSAAVLGLLGAGLGGFDGATSGMDLDTFRNIHGHNPEDDQDEYR